MLNVAQDSFFRGRGVHGVVHRPVPPLATSSCVVWCEMDEVHLHFDALYQLVKLTILLRKHVDDFAHLPTGNTGQLID